jgi:gamma-glutamyltranspeptidase
VFYNIVRFGMTAQHDVEAARWRSWEDGRLQVESGVPADVREQLRGLGHQMQLEDGPSADLGGAQVILADSDGTLTTGADPRREAYALVL